MDLQNFKSSYPVGEEEAHQTVVATVYLERAKIEKKET